MEVSLLKLIHFPKMRGLGVKYSKTQGEAICKSQQQLSTNYTV